VCLFKADEMTASFTSGGDLGLQDGCHLVEVAGWLMWKPAHPLTIGPGKADQIERRGPGGWADG
jgi:hypothetical protein